MAIALDLNPAWSSATSGSTVVTAAFSPAAGSLIIIDSCRDSSTATATATITDSAGLTWTQIGTVQRGINGGFSVAFWAYTATARTNMTATVTWASGTPNGETKEIKATTYTGTASVSAVISKAQSNNSTTNLTVNVTNTNDQCRIAGVAHDWNARGLPTSTDDEVGFHAAGLISGLSVRKSANTTGTGQTVGLNFTAAASGPDWGYKVYEIVPGGGAGQSDSGEAASALVGPTSATSVSGNVAAAESGVALAGTAPALSAMGLATSARPAPALPGSAPALSRIGLATLASPGSVSPGVGTAASAMGLVSTATGGLFAGPVSATSTLGVAGGTSDSGRSGGALLPGAPARSLIGSVDTGRSGGVLLASGRAVSLAGVVDSARSGGAMPGPTVAVSNLAAGGVLSGSGQPAMALAGSTSARSIMGLASSGRSVAPVLFGLSALSVAAPPGTGISTIGRPAIASLGGSVAISQILPSPSPYNVDLAPQALMVDVAPAPVGVDVAPRAIDVNVTIHEVTV